MCKEIRDDPRQVLAILNSLGIVNVTAEELKTFLKALKLYRKIIQKNFQDWKQETVAEILPKHDHIQNNKTDVHKPSVLKALIVNDYEKMNNNYSDSVVNKYQNVIENNKIIETEGSILTTDNFKSSKKNLSFDRLHRNNHELKKYQKHQENVNDSKTIIHSIQKKNKVTSSASIRSTESIVRSKKQESKISLLNKKIINDPVSLYNYYKGFWKQLSIPGEATHTKVRWAVREKILGSNFIPTLQ